MIRRRSLFLLALLFFTFFIITTNVLLSIMAGKLICPRSRSRQIVDTPNTLFSEWLTRIRNSKFEGKEMSNIRASYRICDIHFANDCRIFGRRGANLKADSVPSMHLPYYTPEIPQEMKQPATISAPSKSTLQEMEEPAAISGPSTLRLQECSTPTSLPQHEISSTPETSRTETEVRKHLTVEEKIYYELKKLPIQYKHVSPIQDKTVNLFLENIRKTKNLEELNIEQLWREANSWVSKTHLLNLTSPSLGNVIFALKYSKIIKSDVDTRGTQLKLLLTLEGNQEAVFKPKWYEKERVIEGPVYAGKDRYGSEIIGFYLSVILRRPLTPISVERQLSLKRDIIPVATKRLLETIFEKNNRTCLYGKCYFCKREDPVCEGQNSSLNGAVIFNIKASLTNYRSPWQRTYKKNKKAQWEEYPDTYCRTVKEKLPKKRIFDLIDTSIFDFLIQNGDRHHYETLGDTVIWLDNGKGLGNPFVHHIDILAPLYQCCILRRETWKTLLSLTGGKLREKLESMPDINNFITADHLNAIEERLLIVFATVEYCKHHREAEHYLL